MYIQLFSRDLAGSIMFCHQLANFFTIPKPEEHEDDSLHGDKVATRVFDKAT